MSDAVQMLEEQHAEVTALFMKLDRLRDDTTCAQVFRTIDARLREHAAIEEQIFYPALRERARRKHAADGAEIREALHEHSEIKRALKQLEVASPSSPSFKTQVADLQSLVRHHVQEEQSTILPQARRLFDAFELDDLAYRMVKLASLYSPALEMGGTAPVS